MPALGYEALPHVLWSIAKLKTGMHVPAGASLTSGGGTQQQAHAGHMHVSGMVMSFVKALSAEAHLGLGGYDLTQLRRWVHAAGGACMGSGIVSSCCRLTRLHSNNGTWAAQAVCC